MMRMAVVTMAVVAAMLLTVGLLRGGDDAVLDAKRKVGLQLFSAKKYEEAVSVLTEVVKQDPQQYRDHLLLAKSYAKLGQNQNASEAYRKVLELTSENPRDPDEKQARLEAKAKIQTLDALSAKLDSTLEEFSKRMEAMQNEAEAAKDMGTLQRIARVRVAVDRSLGRDRGFGTVTATEKDWASTEFAVKAGRTYRVIAKGSWRMAKGPESECTADGLLSAQPNEYGRIGQLIGSIDKGMPFIPLGRDGTFVAKSSGTLYLCANDSKDRADNSGSLVVFIEGK